MLPDIKSNRNKDEGLDKLEKMLLRFALNFLKANLENLTAESFFKAWSCCLDETMIDTLKQKMELD